MECLPNKKPMTNLLAYRCKFCGALGTTECDPECPELDKMAWIPLLCCNRCGAYHNWLSRILDRVSWWGRDWSIKSQRDREDGITKTRQMLERFTRHVSTVMCKFYRVEFDWTWNFVDELLAHPEKSYTIIRSYESGLKWKARNHQG